MVFKSIKSILFFTAFFLIPAIISAQGYLHTSGKYIYDGDNNEVILRGIGTGNYMIQEGYMMKTSDVFSTQHEIEAHIKDIIGDAKTDSFYMAWLHKNMTRTDVDSMKAWGFNSIRVAMHYKWFTLPVEDEPVAGKNTWLDTGFNIIDSLLSWCSADQMYLILDMHGTPGGQGKDAAISDYDDTKPSLWESRENKDKLASLWKKLADRYKNEHWIGGYDMINEPNWDFENSGNQNGCNCTQNTPLLNMYKTIIDSIRGVDKNHIVIVEGNCWGNRYNGMANIANFDTNLVFSFHKYWNNNDLGSIQGIINIRNNQNAPIWLGESGENSNTWFTNAIRLCEDNHIGWSWWPVKKNGVNNILMVNANQDYLNLVEYWKGNTSKPSADVAYKALMTWADNQLFENCTIQHDVIDAMIRQPYSYGTKPFKKHTPGSTIFAVDYDMGRNNEAYYDTDTANYNSSSGTYTNWNAGWSYRNDGVDIETCTDTDETNGYSVGWTASGEWMQYTIDADTIAGYTLEIRYASGSSGGSIHFEIDGVPATEKITLAGTGGWQNWQTKKGPAIIFPAGRHKLKLYFETSGINLNYFKLTDPVPASALDFKAIDAQTTDGDTILLSLNKDVTTNDSDITAPEFTVTSNSSPLAISGIKTDPQHKNLLKIGLSSPIFYGDNALISYSGSSVVASTKTLQGFTGLEVRNLLPVRFTIPAKIQAEDYYVNNGLVFEDCSDARKGQNAGYTNAGDYLDFLVYVPGAGNYTLNYRVASLYSNAKAVLQENSNGSFVSIDTLSVASTGGWQNWQTQSSVVNLPAGRYTLRYYIMQGEHNLNWFEVVNYSSIVSTSMSNELKVYPNPANDYTNVAFNDNQMQNYSCVLCDVTGKQLMSKAFGTNNTLQLNIESLEKGLYLVELFSNNKKLAVKQFIKY